MQISRQDTDEVISMSGAEGIFGRGPVILRERYQIRESYKNWTEVSKQRKF